MNKIKKLFLTICIIPGLILLAGYSCNTENKSAEEREEKEEGMKEYVVKEGDTLFSIAERLLGSQEEWQKIAQANDISDPSELSVGQHLLIPYLKPENDYSQIGTASWYGEDFHGEETSSGETYNMYGYTAAHKALPLGTEVKVTNIENGKYAIVTINDRGPYAEERAIDLSYRAAKSIGIKEDGTSKVKIEVISYPEDK